ncbi:hypothetical protein Tco_0586178, partial [Tanacetum coccineum]
MRECHDLPVRSSSVTSYNPSAFPKPSNGNTSSATIILSETATWGKGTLCNTLQLIK